MIRLISFEGGDGSGKTTQMELLETYLVEKGIACVSTREPGGTALGKLIRQALLEAGKEDLSPPAELFLYLADRAQHVREVIQPALVTGRTVLCDRFTDSTVAYQGYGRGVDLALLRRLNQIVSQGITAGLTFLLDCPITIGLSRAKKRTSRLTPGGQASEVIREDRFEREKADFHERVRQGFLELARAEPERLVVLDASRPILEVHEEIKKIVDEKLKGG